MTTLKITGMTCASCASHIADALHKVPGVRSAQVSYADGNAHVATDPGTSLAALTAAIAGLGNQARSEEHTSELQSLMRISYAVFCLKKKNKQNNINTEP